MSAGPRPSAAHMPGSTAAHFDAHSPAPGASAKPPPFTPAPEDAALALRISKLAEYTNRNGKDFEQLLITKQGSNPDYAFLFGGPGCDYYRWCLFGMARGLDVAKALPEGWTDPLASHGPAAGVAQPATPAEMPSAVKDGFQQVLLVLQGTQESIKASSAWFHACALHAAGMADLIFQRLHQLTNYHSKLHVLYLINDILFTGLADGQVANTAIARVFQPGLPAAFCGAYRSAPFAQEAWGQLCGLLDLWKSRHLFDASFIESIKTQMSGSGGPVAAPAASPHAPAAPGMPPSAMPPHHAPHAPAPAYQPRGRGFSDTGPSYMAPPGPAAPAPGPPVQGWHSGHAAPQHGFAPLASSKAANVPPYGVNGGAPGQFGPGPGPPAPGPPFAGHPAALDGPQGPPAPEVEPYDLLSFPAGLIPKLVKHSLQYEKEYTPLLASDVDREPLPRRPVKDQYTQSRLDRFYAELAQYRPGQSRAMYEEKLSQLGGDLLPQADTSHQAEAGVLSVSSETNMRNDGSFAGRGVERGGLGVNSAGDPSDPYNAFRAQKSGRYHTVMAAKSTNPYRPPQGH